MPESPSPSFRIVPSIRALDAAAWDALLDDAATPFVRHAFLSALEESRCAAPRAGWVPAHPTLWRGKRLVAAAPGYVKQDSDGDFARDWDLASAAQRGGLDWYPKLALTVPFTPCTGRRLLVAPGEDRALCVRLLLRGAEEWARDQGVASLQVLFPDAEEAGELAAAGWPSRVSHQYHWFNRGYRDTAGFLSRLTSKKRHMVRREMAQPAKESLRLRTVRGDELRERHDHWARLAHQLHRHTVDKLMWGRRWLDEGFYLRLFAAMPESVELVLAESGERVVAGAFNVASATRLYGRYWGCFEEHPFLHFNVCYYHSVDDCIRRGLQVFEGGAGGDHKLPRGFDPSPTWAALRCLDPRLHEAVLQHLAQETPERLAAIERFREEAGVYRRQEEPAG